MASHPTAGRSQPANISRSIFSISPFSAPFLFSVADVEPGYMFSGKDTERRKPGGLANYLTRSHASELPSMRPNLALLAPHLGEISIKGATPAPTTSATFVPAVIFRWASHILEHPRLLMHIAISKKHVNNYFMEKLLKAALSEPPSQACYGRSDHAHHRKISLT